jgi:isopropylmalate/homocitrate/citramalate synthase
VEEITGIPVSAQEPVVGHNVYSHESGIHTHGVSICRRMYEPIPFEEVGGAARFVYGKHSGSNAVANLLAEHSSSMDFEATRELVLSVVAEIKRVREARTHDDHTREFIRSYYRKLNALGIAEADVIAIAKTLARQQEVQQVPNAELAAMAMKQIANG